MPSFYRWRNRGTKRRRRSGHRAPKARRLDLSLGRSNSRSHSLSIYTKPSISHKENSVNKSLHTRQALNLSLAIYFPTYLLRNVPVVTTLEEYFCLVFVSNQISLLFCLIRVFFCISEGQLQNYSIVSYKVSAGKCTFSLLETTRLDEITWDYLAKLQLLLKYEIKLKDLHLQSQKTLLLDGRVNCYLEKVLI